MNKIVIYKTEQTEFTIEQFESLLKSAKERGATHINMCAFEDGDFELSLYSELPRVEVVNKGGWIRELFNK